MIFSFEQRILLGNQNKSTCVHSCMHRVQKKDAGDYNISLQ